MARMEFTGRDAAEQLHATAAAAALERADELSCAPHGDLAGSAIIHGDNLPVLRALLPQLAGRVKCIYIDPPYNTGSPTRSYHDNTDTDYWLAMLLPRLRLLRELLCDDGLIFVSIDDHEQHRLRMLLDEVFGAAQFRANVIWQKVYSPRMDAAGFSVAHEYILIYGRSASAQPQRLAFTQDARFFNHVEPASGAPYRRRSLRKEGAASLRDDVPGMYYPLIAPDGSLVYPIKPDGTPGRWRWSRRTYERKAAAGAVEWLQRGAGWEPYVRQYMATAATRPPTTIWTHAEVGHTHAAQQEIAELVGPRAFDSPKPVRLIARIVEIATRPDEQAIVLDAFAGSGTTGHAVLECNARDGGDRRFVLIEQAPYAASLTAERVRQARQRYGDAPGFAFFRAVP